MTAGLTIKQDKFAREYVKDGNGTRAARKAGYSGNDNALAVAASRDLLRNPKVSAEIAAHRRRLQERLDISKETLINNAAHIAEQASVDQQYGPAIKATELILKAQGYLVERSMNVSVDVTQSHLDALMAFTDSRIDEKMGRAKEELREASARPVTDIDDSNGS